MVEKNQILEGTVEALGSNGEGIVRNGGITFFVPYSLPTERISFRVLKIKDNIGYGKVEQVFTPSEDRVRPKCPVFQKCGGCQLQHISYADQLSFKQKSVKDALKKIAGIETEVAPCVECDRPYGYRNKFVLPVATDRDKNPLVGFYQERSHRIIPIDACPIHPDWAEKLIFALKTYMTECRISGYDEDTKTGAIRHLVAREIDGRFIVTLVSNEEKLTGLSRFYELITSQIGNCTLYLNINHKESNVIFGDKFVLLFGDGSFEGKELGVLYEAGPKTFVQVNADTRKKLYLAVLDTLKEYQDGTVVDCYSGGGLLTAMIAKHTKKVYGIELEKEAVACADALKEKNKLFNITNICGKVEDELEKVLEKEKGEKLALVLDPPRAGIARSVVKALISSGIEHLTLVSCNPSTLARDLGLLTGTLCESETGELKKTQSGGAYRIESITPYDMFPQTKHVETLVCLARKTK